MHQYGDNIKIYAYMAVNDAASAVDHESHAKFS